MPYQSDGSLAQGSEAVVKFHPLLLFHEGPFVAMYKISKMHRLSLFVHWEGMLLGLSEGDDDTDGDAEGGDEADGMADTDGLEEGL